MSKAFSALSFVVILAVQLCMAAGANAAPQYWDPNQAAAGLGGAGTWNAAGNTNWNDSSGTGTPQQWTNGNEAFFQGSAGTVTLGSNVTANTITMGTTAYTFNPTAAFTMEFNSLTVPTANGIATTLQGGLAGTLSGPDDLTIISNNGPAIANNVLIGNVNANTFTGNVNLNGSGAGTTSASRLALLINSIGAIPSTANFNYGRSMSQVLFNIAGNHGTVSSNFNLNTGNIGTFEGWIGALVGAQVNLSGVVSGNGTLTFGLGLSGGAGIITLSNNSTYTGSTKFIHAQTGVVKLGVDNALPTTTGIIMSTGSTNVGSIDLNGKNQTIASLASNTTGVENGIANTAGASATSVLTINGSATTTYDGPLGSVANATNMPGAAADLAKIRLVLHASNTGQLTLATPAGVAYSEGTEVNGGTLLVTNTSGSGTGTGAVVVNGGTFGGSGSVSGSVTMNGGTLSPGTSIETLGTGAISFGTGSTFKYEMQTTQPLATAADLLDANGNFDIATGVTLALFDLGAAAVTVGNKLTMIAYDGIWNNGTFTGYTDESVFFFGANYWQINYNDNTAGSNFATETADDAHFLTLTAVAVPEASSIIAMGLTGMFAGAVAWMRKRKGLSITNI